MLADRIAQVDWLPEGKGRCQAAFCCLLGLVSRVGADKVTVTHFR